MRALVTGADGFVGGYLINYLLAETDLEIIGTVYKYRQQPDPDFGSNRVQSGAAGFTGTSCRGRCAWPAIALITSSIWPGKPLSRFPGRIPGLTFEQNVFTSLNLFQGAIAADLDTKILVVGSGDEYGDCPGRLAGQ